MYFKKINFNLVLFLSSLFLVNNILFLFYDINQSPDFTAYSSYFDFFFYKTEIVNRDQGLFYYFLQSISLYLKSYQSQLKLSSIILHYSIFQINNIIYLYGLVGYYFLLKFYNLSNKFIFLIFTFLNFFPLTMMLKLTLKPEILAFSFLPWVILFLENYKKYGKLKHLFYVLPYLTILLTSKSSIAIISLTFLFFSYLFQIIKLNKKHFIIFSILITITFLALFFENSFYGANMFNFKSGSNEEIEIDAEKYNNKAPLNIVYNINLYKLFTSPIKNDHKDSFIAITLLDSFGDYFDLYWNNNDSIFFENKFEIIELIKLDEIKSPKILWDKKVVNIYVQKETDLYLRQTVSLLLGIVFYISLLFSIFRKYLFRKFLLSPIYGMLIILVHIIFGFPSNNFDPLTGDSLKPFYYSFLLCLAFIFYLAERLKETKNLKIYTSLFIYIFLILFIIGFPKYHLIQSSVIADANQYSTFCEVNNFFIGGGDQTNNCKNIKINLNFSKQQVRFPLANTLLFIWLIFVNLQYLREKHNLQFFTLLNKNRNSKV